MKNGEIADEAAGHVAAAVEALKHSNRSVQLEMVWTTLNRIYTELTTFSSRARQSETNEQTTDKL